MTTETPSPKPLRYGWTTGACATAAAKAAYSALLGYGFPDPVTIDLPRDRQAYFSLAEAHCEPQLAQAGVIKDAGDDPDVTHGALICATLRPGRPGEGITFHAGRGVGRVTKPGLPLSVGEPAINPAPRAMIIANLTSLSPEGIVPDMRVEISIPNGEILAEKTWNARLGILGGLSILGTTGIVVPYSCAAWIHSIYRGVDVARATGETHLLAAVGKTSEFLINERYHPSTGAIIDMGNFVGALLKYLRRNPVGNLTIAGGFGKMVKLAQGESDLHSKAASVDQAFLARLAAPFAPTDQTDYTKANSALEILQSLGGRAEELAQVVAELALASARQQLGEAQPYLEILIADRQGNCLAFAREQNFAPFA